MRHHVVAPHSEARRHSAFSTSSSPHGTLDSNSSSSQLGTAAQFSSGRPRNGLTALGHDVAQALRQAHQVRTDRRSADHLGDSWAVRDNSHLGATPCAHRLAAKLPPLSPFLMPGQARLRLTPDHTLPASLVTLDAVGAGVGACASIQRSPGVRSSASIRGCASISSRAYVIKAISPPNTPDRTNSPTSHQHAWSISSELFFDRGEDSAPQGRLFTLQMVPTLRVKVK